MCDPSIELKRLSMDMIARIVACVAALVDNGIASRGSACLISETGSLAMTQQQMVINLIEQWWKALEHVPQNNNLPAKGTLAGALVVLERLKTEYVLDIAQHRAERGQSQIRGVSKAKVQEILARFGETREFLKEGGRTNRGLAGALTPLLDALKNAQLDALSRDERNAILTEAQRRLAGKVGEYFSRECIKIAYDPTKTAWQAIHEILAAAKRVGKEGPVSQYLVGAKLALRFPERDIRNDVFSAQDKQLGHPGDFLVGDTVFHVTVAPNSGHLEKCKANVSEGRSAYLLVPDRILVGARQNAENFLPGQITVQSIESFVSQNIEELASFSKGEFVSGFRRLLETYNERVGRVESDESMLIEAPPNVLQR